jgi:hypothetical protein
VVGRRREEGVAALVAYYLAGRQKQARLAGNALLESAVFDVGPLLGEGNRRAILAEAGRIKAPSTDELCEAARYYRCQRIAAALPALRTMSWYGFYLESCLVGIIARWDGAELFLECVRSRRALADCELERELRELVALIPDMFRIPMSVTINQIINLVALEQRLLREDLVLAESKESVGRCKGPE